jgi:hypothetical protein
MAWDYEEALELIETSGGTVALVLAGHDHAGGFAQGTPAAGQSTTEGMAEEGASGGTYYVTLQSPLNRGRDGACFGVVELFEDKIVVKGPELKHLVHASVLKKFPLMTGTAAPSVGGNLAQEVEGVVSLPLASPNAQNKKI